VPPPPSQTRVPGPFREPFLAATTTSFELHPSFGFTEAYTDNFTLGSSGRTHNFRSSLNSGFSLLINRPKTKGTVSGNISASQDSATGQADYQIFPTLNGSVRHTFDPRLSLTVTDSFTRSDEPSQGDGQRAGQAGDQPASVSPVHDGIAARLDLLAGVLVNGLLRVLPASHHLPPAHSSPKGRRHLPSGGQGLGSRPRRSL